MKKLLFILFIISASINYAQTNEIMVQNLNGTSFDLNELIEGQEDQPVIFVTWAKKWCWPCVKMLNRLNGSFSELQENYNLKVIALNLDSEYTRQEIKQFAYENNWDFDIYMDSDKNYMDATNTTSAPSTMLLLNDEVITVYVGFKDGISNPETTADYFIEILNDLNSNIMYFDIDWKNTTKKNASFVRYRDKIDGKYEVTDRWITGEIQMKGTYTDFYCKNRTGEFKYYNKDGTLSSVETF